MTAIPPPIQEPLNTYLGVQIKPKQSAHDVAAIVMSAAKDMGVLFRRLEMLDTISVGTFSYARMRTDIVNPVKILNHLRSVQHATIAYEEGDYVLTFPDGRVGRVPNLVMHAIPKLGQSRMYRGTRIKHWERQFEAA